MADNACRDHARPLHYGRHTNAAFVSLTFAYCRARLKIPFQAVRNIARQIALSSEAAFDQLAEVEFDSEGHPVVAEVQSQTVGGRILLVAGFTTTAADTIDNQEAFPQNPAPKEGLGFPVIRCVSLISMLVADGYLCTYWIVAACKIKGVNIVMKNHDKRHDDPLGARRIDKHQRTTVWLRPQRPDWMSEQEYH